MPAVFGSRPRAFILRTLSAIIIFLHYNLFAGELSDTPLFIAALVSALALSWFLYFFSIRPPIVIAVILGIPWLIKFFLLSLSFIPVTQLSILSLHFDRNFAVFILPVYWMALGSYGSLRSSVFLRRESLALLLPVILFFIITDTDALEIYALPVYSLAVFGLVTGILLSVLVDTAPRSLFPQTKEKTRSRLLSLMLIILAAVILLRPSEEQALEQGGGLLKPDLFRFDFSQFLRLESEISLNDDLVLIVRKEPENTQILLRRFILSEYQPGKGFLRSAFYDENEHPQRLPDQETKFSQTQPAQRRISTQDYFLINLDPSVFIAMNSPFEVTPYKNWDSSSFSSAYTVKSYTNEALPFELMDSVPENWTPQDVDLSEEAYTWYTDYGDDPRIAAYAQEITADIHAYWDQIQSVYEHLKYGSYRYSLKPGLAADGDQLGHFLFESKKGYCSYFAFSMALLLRSLGIPSRVAVGFFIDSDTNTFNYYPVRSNMAHAWVEVYFNEYGWVEYDPTSLYLAEGESFGFSSGSPTEHFEHLMQEILENRSSLQTREINRIEEQTHTFSSYISRTLHLIQSVWIPLCISLLLLMFIYIRFSWFILAQIHKKRVRVSSLYLAKHTLRRLMLAGFTMHKNEITAEYLRRIDPENRLKTGALWAAVNEAKFASTFSHNERKNLDRLYSDFSEAYNNTVPCFRRFLALIVPPLALLLAKMKAKHSLLVLLAFILFLPVRDMYGQNTPSDLLYTEALDAQEKERWEQAITLLHEGYTQFPDDSRFPSALGDLYVSRELYQLAWEAYRQAEKVNPSDPDLLYKLSTTAGRLNLDLESIAYLNQVYSLQPDNKDVISDLAWMYFKTHRLREGESLLLNALDRLGHDRGFLMTLGTIYSDMFRYDESKTHYLDSIQSALADESWIFAAVAYYNLSILESRFYNFSNAFEMTNASLEAMDRSSGHLARGELYLRQLDFAKAFAEYQQAYAQDNSPLSQINLAQAYQFSGKLQDSVAYAENILDMSDLSWMFNYGTDIHRYRRDLHEILHKAYNGLAWKERYSPAGSFLPLLEQVKTYITYRIQAWKHKKLYEKYSLFIAEKYEQEEQILDANIHYYDAFKEYPGRALRYLVRAEQHETTLIPEAYPSYQLERGIISKDINLIGNAIQSFDPVWERDQLAKAYTALCSLPEVKRNKTLRTSYAETLYALNRGALLQNGIRLPLALSLNMNTTASDQQMKDTMNTLVTILKSIGVQVLGSDADYEARFTLSVRIEPDRVAVQLTDNVKGISVLRKSLDQPQASSQGRRSFALALSNILFTME